MQGESHLTPFLSHRRVKRGNLQHLDSDELQQIVMFFLLSSHRVRSLALLQFCWKVRQLEAQNLHRVAKTDSL